MTLPMLRRLAPALLAALLAVGLAGCADDDTPAAGGGTDGVSLAYTLWPEGRDTTVDSSSRHLVECDDTGNPDCAALLALGDETWDPVPPGTACTEIFGGPQVLEVTGMVGERTVNSTFTRANGCEIARWDAAVPAMQRLAVPGAGGWAPFEATELRVTHRPTGTADGERTLTVTCPEEPAATDKDCQELLDLARGDLFDAALPPGTVCTQLFGGPQTATVEGILAGRNVTTTFTRVDGCQIDRWDRAMPLLLRMGRP